MSFEFNSNFKAPLFNPPPKPTLDVDQANKAKLQGEVTSTQFPAIGNLNTPFQEIKPLPPGIIGGQFPIKAAAPFDFPTVAVTQALQTIANRFGKKPPQLQGQAQVTDSNTGIGFAPSPSRPVTLDMLTQALRTNLLGRKGAPILIALIQNYNDILKLAPQTSGTKPVLQGLTPSLIQTVAKRDGKPSRFSLGDIRIQDTSPTPTNFRFTTQSVLDTLKQTLLPMESIAYGVPQRQKPLAPGQIDLTGLRSILSNPQASAENKKIAQILIARFDDIVNRAVRISGQDRLFPYISAEDISNISNQVRDLGVRTDYFSSQDLSAKAPDFPAAPTADNFNITAQDARYIISQAQRQVIPELPPLPDGQIRIDAPFPVLAPLTAEDLKNFIANAPNKKQAQVAQVLLSRFEDLTYTASLLSPQDQVKDTLEPKDIDLIAGNTEPTKILNTEDVITKPIIVIDPPPNPTPDNFSFATQDVFDALGLKYYPPGYKGPRVWMQEPPVTSDAIRERLNNLELSDKDRLILKILLTRFDDIQTLANTKSITGEDLQKIAFRNGDGKTFDSEDLKPDIPIIIDPPLDTPTVFKFETQQVLSVFDKAVSSQYPDGYPTNNFAAPTLSKETLLKFLTQLPANSDEATIIKILITNYDLMTFIPRGVAPMPGEILPTKPFNAALIKEVAGQDGSDFSFSSDDLDILRNRPPVP